MRQSALNVSEEGSPGTGTRGPPELPERQLAEKPVGEMLRAKADGMECELYQ